MKKKEIKEKIETAIENHKKLWNMMANESAVKEHKLSKEEVITSITTDVICNNCFCCNLVYELKGRLDCSMCPLVWGYNATVLSTVCESQETLYTNYKHHIAFEVDTVDTLENYINICKDIANLPMKNNYIEDMCEKFGEPDDEQEEEIILLDDEVNLDIKSDIDEELFDEDKKLEVQRLTDLYVSQHKLLWLLIATETLLQGKEIQKHHILYKYRDIFIPLEIANDCYACGLDRVLHHTIYGDRYDSNCDMCPFSTSWEGGNCTRHGSLYARWLRSNNIQESARLALKIATMPVDENFVERVYKQWVQSRN